MTDRERVAPADEHRPPLIRPSTAALPHGELDSPLLPDSVSRGNGLLMSVTIATRSSPRLLTTDSPPVDPVRAWLTQLPAELPAFAPVPFAASESCTPAEAHAAARAAGCPDLFLIHAPEPAARERVIAATARLAAGRVLILSPDPDAADRLTERLAKPGVVRALADDENPIRPSPLVAKLTSTALGPGRVEQFRREAAASLASIEARLADLDRLAALDAELTALAAERACVEAEIRAGHGGADLAANELELAELRRRHAEAAFGKKSGLFARLFGRPKPAGPSAAELEKEIHVREAAVAALAAARDNAVRSALTERCAPLDHKRQEREAERDCLSGRLGSMRRVDVEHALSSARARLDELTAPEIVRRLLAEPRIVVGTPGSLQADPVFDMPPADGPPFALLVLDHCEELAEPDFLRLAALASRWVLVGEAQPREAPRPPGGNGKPQRNGRLAESFAARLARLLDSETWAHEADRLVCRLMHSMTATGRAMLTREPLLDRPEIELRFATDGDGEPVVAEVAFPAATPIAEAKAFVFHQLGEVLLHPCGEHNWDHSSALAVRWSAGEHPSLEPVWIDLEAGVREKVAAAGLVAFTAAIEFDSSAGWDRDKAEAWLAKHLRTETAGRFAMLPSEGKRR